MKAVGKLDEAKYFLEQMKLSIKDRRVFKYNLSAFLSSARSVTFILQKEYARNSKFKEWYGKKQIEMRKDELLNFFVRKRNYVVKKGPLETRAEVSVKVYESIIVSDNVTVALKKHDGTEEIVYQTAESEVKSKQKPKETEIEYRWFFEDYPGKDVVALCEEYLEKLTEIMEEAKKVAQS